MRLPAQSFKGKQANPTKYVKVKELPIPTQSLEDEQAK